MGVLDTMAGAFLAAGLALSLPLWRRLSRDAPDLRLAAACGLVLTGAAWLALRALSLWS